MKKFALRADRAFFLAVGSLLLSTGSARADDGYFKLFGGLNFVPKQDFYYEDAVDPLLSFLVDGSFWHETGMLFGAAAGYSFGVQENLSLFVEGEISLRSNDFDSYEGTDEFGMHEEGSEDGTSNLVSYMANFGLATSLTTEIDLYGGAGVGLSRWHYEYDGGGDPGFAGDQQTALAWQAFVGAGYEVAPGFSLSAEYRYFGTKERTFHHVYDTFAYNDRITYDSHSVLLTARVEFNPLLRAFGVR